MLSRSIAVLAKPYRVPPFASFYSKIARSLTRTKSPLRMKVGGALWTLTAPQHKGLSSSKLAERAEALYKKYGNSVLAKARTMKQRGLTPQTKRTKSAKTAKLNAKLNARKPLRAVTKVGKGSRKTGPQHPRLAKAQKSVPGGKSEPKGVSLSQKRHVPPKWTQRPHSSSRLSLDTRGKHPKAAAGLVGANINTDRSPFETFRTSVIKRGNFKPSSILDRQINYLWRLISTQTNLDAKAREYMALRLIKKSIQASKKKLQNTKKVKVSAKTKAVQKVVNSLPKAPKASGMVKLTRNTKKDKKKTSVSSRNHRSPYLRFYRAMVLTGSIPNHPKGVRSRMIKKLWYSTSHLKSLNSKIKLGIAFATGAQEPPEALQVTEDMTNKASSKPSRMMSPAKVRVKKVSKSTSFEVPSDYEVDPFLATYKVLMKYVPNKTADARMRAISRAWMLTDVPDRKDKRTPEQRIQAVASKLALL